jgi:probable HAF family extracellular repeat protein
MGLKGDIMVFSPSNSLKLHRGIMSALVIIIMISLSSVPGFPNTYTIYPTADATVYSAAPNDNFGTEPIIDVYLSGNTTLIYAYTFFKFDLSSIPASEKITGGTLFANCYNFTGVSNITIQLRAVSDVSWSETGVTWNNQPAYGDLIAVTSGKTGWYQWKIPGSNLPATGLISYMVMPSTGGLSRFRSREYGGVNQPFLLVTTTKKTAAPRYIYRSLGVLPDANYTSPWSINDSGQVVGSSGNSSTGWSRAFLKTGSQPMVDLGTLGGQGSFGADINNAGQVVGDALDTDGIGRAFLKNPGELMADLGLGEESWAAAINASGQVVGQAKNSSGVLRAFLKSPEQPMEDLGALGGPASTSFANEINASGQVVGQAQNSSGFGRAFLKSPGVLTMEDLGTLGGNNSEAMHINSYGQVVGGAENAAGLWRGFLKNPGQPLLDLGTLGGDESGVVGFNNPGQVVGSAKVDASTWHAFVWEDGVMHDLNHVTVNLPPGVVLRDGRAINDRGWIVGQDNNEQGFLLLPEASIMGPLQLLLLD